MAMASPGPRVPYLSFNVELRGEDDDREHLLNEIAEES